MRIDRIEAYAVRYHAEPPLTLSGGRRITAIEGTVVKVYTDDGLVGWGEQSPFPGYMVADAYASRAALAALGEVLIGVDPRRPKHVQRLMRARLKGHHATRAMLDTACWDILGKSLGVPVAALTGGVLAPEQKLLRAIGIGPAAAMAETMAALVADGYEYVQVKLGDDWRADVERATACLASAAVDTTVIFDANGHWRTVDAVRFATAIGPGHILEQPCDTVAQCLAVRDRTGSLLSLDESLVTLTAALPVVQTAGLDAAMVKLSRFGGITPTLLLRDVCERAGVPVIVEDGGPGDIQAAASMQVAASTDPAWLFCGSLTNVIVRERLASGAPRHTDGRARLPSGPGLGLGEVDEDRLGDPVLVIT